MPQGLSAHRPTAYQARPGGRPVSRQPGPSAQRSIPARPLEGPSAAGSAARPRGGGGRFPGWFHGWFGCNRYTRGCAAFTPSARWLQPSSRLGVHLLHPAGPLSTASPPVAAGWVIAPRQTGRQRPAAQPWRG